MGTQQNGCRQPSAPTLLILLTERRKNTVMIRLALLGTLFAFAAISAAEIKTERVEYKDGDTVLEGYIAYDTNIKGPRPGVVIVHDWNGTDEYEERRARMLAELGYVGFAADIYGKGNKPKTQAENGQMAGKYRNDMPLFISRMNAAVSTLRARTEVQKDKVAAMGYCFGGGGVSSSPAPAPTSAVSSASTAASPPRPRRPSDQSRPRFWCATLPRTQACRTNS